MSIGKQALALMLLALSLCTGASASGSEPNQQFLEAKPSRCVALHEGQACYQRTRLIWSSETKGNYCLYKEDQSSPIECWQDAHHGEAIYTFESSKSTVFYLTKQETGSELSRAKVSVAWVYAAKTRRKTQWRLF